MEVFVLILISSFAGLIKSEDCISRKFQDGIVCVCNSTYCDSVAVDVPEKGSFRSYISSRDGKRFHIEDGTFGYEETGNKIELTLDVTKTFQEIKGFGGAFTDSAGLNIKKLSNATQENLMQTYFSKTGSSYSLGRIPIGGTDFSTRPYTLDDTRGDTRLLNFSLTSEDENYKIPYMKRALEINPQLRFVAASWSAPAWMKTNNDVRGFLGKLKDQYYQVYAEYLVKFLEIYKNRGLKIWAMSTGNEPINPLIPLVSINDMLWTPSTVTKWLVNNLGPTVEKSNSNETMILAMDDQRFNLPWWIEGMYKTDKSVDKYISGIAVHWYGDILSVANAFDKTHDKYPSKFILMTEACSGSFPSKKGVILGSWERGENYIKSIIADMNHWVTGWMDWNLALDKTGGPTWVDNRVDSPVIVNPETDEFFKQPMYYALAHVSKFVPPGSVRISIQTRNPWIHSTAFKTPEDNIVIVLYNPSNRDKQLIIVDDNGKKNLNIQMHPRSMRTIIYKN